MTRKREVLASEDISDLPPPTHRHPMSGEPIWDQHAVRAMLRAPVADERVLPPLPHIPTSYLQLKNLDKIHGMMRNYALAALANAAATDRAMLQSVLQDLEKSESVCSRCGHSDSCADMDVAYMIRGHLKGDASAPADEPPGCPTYVCRAAQADGVLCANDECDRANGVRPASAPVADERAIGLFREALAWGCVYGPKLKKDQWERMRDETAQQFSQRLAALISPPVDEGELRTAFNEWIDKTDFIQQRIASGALPVKYLGWHRADVMRDLIDAALASAPVAGEARTEGGDPASPRDDSDRTYDKPIGYLPAYELGRLHSGHSANLRSAKFGPSALDGDVPVYLEPPNGDAAPQASTVAGEAKPSRQTLLDAIWRHGNARAMAEHNIAYRDEVRNTADALLALFDAAPQASAENVRNAALDWEAAWRDSRARAAALEEAATAEEARIGVGEPGIDTQELDRETQECANAIRALKPQADKDGGQQRAGDVDERAAFEAWAYRAGMGPKFRESMFAAWEARAALSAPQAEQGERDA